MPLLHQGCSCHSSRCLLFLIRAFKAINQFISLNHFDKALKSALLAENALLLCKAVVALSAGQKSSSDALKCRGCHGWGAHLVRERAKGHHSQLQNGTLLILYFKSAPQTLTLWCPKRSPEVVVAVGWLEGEDTIPPSSPGPE